jgi:hypothetical protein
MYFHDQNESDNTGVQFVGPRYYVTPATQEDFPTSLVTRPVRQYRRNNFVSQMLENKDAIQEYGRVIKKRGRLHGSGFLYEPHMFGHDVLFPVPMHSNLAAGRKLSLAENGPKKDSTPAVALNVPEMVLPGKFRIMKK